MTHDLSRFGLQEITECGVAVRRIGEGHGTMEAVASEIARLLHTSIREAKEDSAPQCALVRLYKTHTYADLDEPLRKFADTCLPWGKPTEATRCLTLLGTAGDEPAWNDRKKSAGHQAIPLLNADVLSQIPMIARLMQQFGVDLKDVVGERGGLLLDAAQTTYNVFHVEEAKGSPYIPAQDNFVIPHKIRSVIGFGGVLPSGDLFATILFTKVPVPRETAELFKTLALSVKVALLSHERSVFQT